MRLGWLASLFFSLALGASVASAQAEHTVREGQSLARIARRHHVDVASLAAANGLSRDSQVRPGQVLRVPEAGTHYVGRGDTLGSIARQHGCSVADITRLNRLGRDARVRLGQRLVLPGFAPERERGRAAPRGWGEPRSPGVATIYRSALGRRFRIRLVDERGRVRRTARLRLGELMMARGRGRRHSGPNPPPRLIEILARTSDHFGGRTITLVSGYREAGGYTRESSRHTRGHAIDVRIQGVPNEELRDYLRATFRNVGVGYYPRSSFVHLDVRERGAYWVDWSRSGERPQYQRRGASPPEDATADEVRRTGMGGDDVGEDEGAVAEEDDGTNPDSAAVVVEDGESVSPDPTTTESTQ